MTRRLIKGLIGKENIFINLNERTESRCRNLTESTQSAIIYHSSFPKVQFMDSDFVFNRIAFSLSLHPYAKKTFIFINSWFGTDV